LLLCVLCGSVARAAEVEVLRQAGPADKRFNVAVLGDGYRTQDQAELTTDAKAIIDYWFGVTPLKQYAQFFNVKLVHVVSNDNGADNGTYGATRDTALDANFGCDGIDRLLCVDDGKVAVAAAADVPEYNFAIVLVNDPKYGGSGGPVCVSSSNPQSFEVLAHESGHSLAHLADEYSYAGNQPPCDPQKDCPEANVTLRTTLDQIKWKDWIDATTPLPTPATAQYATVTGLFEGARYTPTGVYRPQQDCKMRDLGVPLCTVCTEQYVRSIWTSDNIQMIEATMPAQPNVSSASCDPIALSVTTPPITPSTYRYVWTVDGKTQTEPSNAIELMPSVLMTGDHQVDLAVEDTTAMVRTDPNNVLKDHFSWTVSVAKSDCALAAGGSSMGGGAGAGASVAGAGAGGVPPSGAAGSAAASGAGQGSGGAGTSAGAGGSAGGNASSAGSVAARAAPPPTDAGCGCSLPGDRRPSAWPLALLAFASALARRRRFTRA
jgi:MYXO-CTERM domain-containing protein